MYHIGVDVGGTNIATGITDENGKIIKKISVKTLGDREPQEIAKDIASSVKKIMEETGITEKDFEVIGIGIPGCTDNKTGYVLKTENMNLTGFPLVKEIQKYIDKPVLMANDANCAVLGEMVAGGAKGYSNVLMITLGTGIGGGFVLDQKIYEGATGAALEAGHMVIVDNGVLCNCGRKGCFEKYASATALVRITEEYMAKYPDSLMKNYLNDSGKVNGMTAFKAAKAGDKAADMVVEEFSRYLALGISNLINLFQPEVLLVGGGISNEGDYLLDRVRKYVAEWVYAYGIIKSTVIKRAELANDAGIIGAAFLK